jgi:hypothetical protein
MSVHYFQRLRDPREQAGHPPLEPEVKRAILASWASDAFAVRSRQALRKPPELPGPIPVRDVLDALKSLDSAG